MALTEQQMDSLHEVSKYLYTIKNAEQQAAEIAKVTLPYGKNNDEAYAAVLANLTQFQQNEETKVGPGPATGIYVVPPGVLNVSASAGTGPDGYTGSSATALYGAHLEKGQGLGLGLGGALTLDADNKISSASAIAQYTGQPWINDPAVPVDIIPINQHKLSMNKSGDLSGQGLAGTVTTFPNGVAITDAFIATSEGALIQYHRDDFHLKAGDVDLSLYDAATATINDPKKGLGLHDIGGTAGIAAQGSIGDGVKLYADLHVGAGNMMNNGVRDWNAGATIALTTAPPPAPAKTDPNQTIAPLPERTLVEKIDYFKTLAAEQQDFIVERIAKDHRDKHQELNLEQAKAIVWQEIKAPEKQDLIDLTRQL